MYKITNALKIIVCVLLAIVVIYLLACYVDIAKNCGENPTFADWNAIYKIFIKA